MMKSSKKFCCLVLVVFALLGCKTTMVSSGGDNYFAKGDYVAAAQKYQAEAGEGSAEARFNLGVMYAEGKGVEKNDAMAMSLFESAAKDNFAPAQTLLGMRYYMGDVIPQDYSSAMRWFTRAADNGDPVAMYALGNMYTKGQGVTANEHIARSYYLRAEAYGFTRASE